MTYARPGEDRVVGQPEAIPRPGVVRAPLGLPSAVPQPNRLPPMRDASELGRLLFLDRRLSKTGTVACASCHRPSMAFTEGAALGEGADRQQTARKAPSLLNVGYRPLLRWDGYPSSLENFIEYPVCSANEMHYRNLDQLTESLRGDEVYREAFARVFGGAAIDFEKVKYALGAFLRSLTSANSPFDRYFFGGDAKALSEPAARGLALFVGKARCAECHPIGDHDALFTDFEFHNLGIGWRADVGRFDDVGLGGIRSVRFVGRFLTPSLRDVARTAPYMHDRSLATLDDVVSFFDRGGDAGADRDPRLEPLGLTAQEKADLLAFLQSLTGDADWTPDARPRRSSSGARN